MDGIVLPLREQLIGVSFDLTPMTMLAILLLLLPLLVSSKNSGDTAALGKKVIEIYFVPHFDKKEKNLGIHDFNNNSGSNTHHPRS